MRLHDSPNGVGSRLFLWRRKTREFYSRDIGSFLATEAARLIWTIPRPVAENSATSLRWNRDFHRAENTAPDTVHRSSGVAYVPPTKNGRDAKLARPLVGKRTVTLADRGCNFVPIRLFHRIREFDLTKCGQVSGSRAARHGVSDREVMPLRTRLGRVASMALAGPEKNLEVAATLERPFAVHPSGCSLRSSPQCFIAPDRRPSTFDQSDRRPH